MPRSAVIRLAGTRARSPAVSMPRRCCAIDNANRDRPAAASGVAGDALAAASARLARAYLGRVGWPRRRLCRFVAVGGGGGERRDRVQFAEDVGPGAGHVAQRPEPLGGVTVQRDREELHQAVAGHRVEEVLGELHFLGGVEEPGVGQVVAPGRELAAGHLVQRDRDRVQLGGLVVALPGRAAEERVQVAAGARDQVGVRGAGQGEVEQDQFAALAVELSAAPGCPA